MIYKYETIKSLIYKLSKFYNLDNIKSCKGLVLEYSRKADSIYDYSYIENTKYLKESRRYYPLNTLIRNGKNIKQCSHKLFNNDTQIYDMLTELKGY